MKQLGLGIIGLGVGRGALLLNRDAKSPITVRAVADLDPERLEQATGEYGVTFATTDYRELLERPDVDVVGVFTPDHLHVEHLPAALEAGKHVICTKPLLTTLEDCDKVVALVRRTGLKFVVAQTWRFIPHIVAVKQAVDEGRIGRINLIETGYIHDLRRVCGDNTLAGHRTAELPVWRRCSRYRLPEVVRRQHLGGKCVRHEIRRHLGISHRRYLDSESDIREWCVGSSACDVRLCEQQKRGPGRRQ